MASSLQLSNGHMLQRSLQCSRRGLAFKPATSRQSLRVAMSKGFGADAKPAKQVSTRTLLNLVTFHALHCLPAQQTMPSHVFTRQYQFHTIVPA